MTTINIVGGVVVVCKTITKGADFAPFSSSVAASLRTTDFLAATPPIDVDERDHTVASRGEEKVNVTTYGIVALVAAACSSLTISA